MVKRRLNSHRHMINVLAEASPKLRKAILQHADKPLIQTLTEAVCNTLSGDIPLKKNVQKQLQKYKAPLRSIACPKSKWKAKQRVLIQHGGFLPILMPIIASALSGLVSHFISK